MFAVTPGPLAVTDTQGVALCHATRQTKRSLNSTTRRRVVAVWEDSLRDAGLMVGTRVLCTDMVWRDRGRGEDQRDGYADFGHIVADSLDGAYCGCNALPVEGKTNREDGDCRPTVHPDYPLEALRVAFRARALANMTNTKRNRAA
jgi:hypothetical protein